MADTRENSSKAPRWTAAELETVRVMEMANASAAEIAEAVGRTPGAVSFQLSIMRRRAKVFPR